MKKNSILKKFTFNYKLLLQADLSEVRTINKLTVYVKCSIYLLNNLEN
jgi:hypothetical protein